MQINLLGPFELFAETRPVSLTAPKIQQTLAVLASSVGYTVPTESIMTELWPRRRPRSAGTTVQTYIYVIRSALRDDAEGDGGAGVSITTEPGGYRLSLRREQIDAERFGDLVATAGRMLEEHHAREHGHDDLGPVRDAAKLLGEARELWRGRPFTGIATGPVLTPIAVRLEQLWVRSRKLLIRTELLLGRHRELVSEVKQLTAAFPTDEMFHAQLMVVLYRCGRRGEALQVYRRFRDTLRTELALRPSPRIEQLRKVISVDEHSAFHLPPVLP
ncbi:AfsR/SARP family transcriptional regulator [Dactylosporangium sp. AC04546]|uniref:AfsR/SARP family transcriptional regulator n=1 Tax=Dactylosporangium sp. AC04546 TaxID=2862460 RepID=UPI001EDD4290|nr:AfsR/SARP family transcriptional regulator [Dactylosporangium sp. AC04546]WVK79073.1 AfsR/SARP family transcriptional regulator [Dactylosporangium sp. AC04546]